MLPILSHTTDEHHILVAYSSLRSKYRSVEGETMYLGSQDLTKFTLHSRDLDDRLTRGLYLFQKQCVQNQTFRCELDKLLIAFCLMCLGNLTIQIPVSCFRVRNTPRVIPDEIAAYPTTAKTHIQCLDACRNIAPELIWSDLQLRHNGVNH